MAPFTIIWDFDGTLLPSDPYDSEQTLLRYSLKCSEERLSPAKRIVSRIITFADRKEWIGPAFKKYYTWVVAGMSAERLDRVAEILSRKITEADRASLRQLRRDGHAMQIISCGTLDLIERVLALANLDHLFGRIDGNRLLFSGGRIAGMDIRILYPDDKLKPLKEQEIDAQRTIAVGDGYTDLPLLDWAGFPVLIDRTGRKRERGARRRYHEIASVSELLPLIDRGFNRRRG
jgi:phosphoserine phosphatase